MSAQWVSLIVTGALAGIFGVVVGRNGWRSHLATLLFLAFYWAGRLA